MQTATCRAHDRTTGQPCASPPLANTGLCTKHGGPAVEKSIAVNTKHGAFARILPQALNDDFQATRSDPNALSLADEIALLRTFLAHYLGTFQDDRPITAEDLERVGRQVDRISRLTMRQSRLLAEDSNRLSAEAINSWAGRMRDVMRPVLGEFLPDPAACLAAHDRLTDLMAQHDLLPALPEQPQEPDPASARQRAFDGIPLALSAQQKVSDGFPLPANEVSEVGTSGAQRRLRASVGPGGRLPANEVAAPLAALAQRPGSREPEAGPLTVPPVNTELFRALLQEGRVRQPSPTSSEHAFAPSPVEYHPIK